MRGGEGGEGREGRGGEERKVMNYMYHKRSIGCVCLNSSTL